MKYYELLFILPGTLGEDEVAPIVKSVKDVVEKATGTDAKMQDLGKSRIAYPMKHIRYGYFQLCQFESETKNISEINDKLRLMPELLRVAINRKETAGGIVEKVSAISDVTVRDNKFSKNTATGERKPETKRSEHIEVGHQIGKKQVKPKVKTEEKVKTETKAENIKMEDIDKKLDELLEDNIADV